MNTRLTIPGILIATVCVTTSMAQSGLSGKVIDQKGNAVPYANVVLLSLPDSVFIKGTVSTTDGEFHLEQLSPGSYMVRITMIGYKPAFQQVTHTASGPALGEIAMEEESIQLAELVFRGDRPAIEHRIDRLVINTKDNPTASGSNALDLIARSPGVLVNRQSNEIQISGKSGVTIMINGKTSQIPATYLLQFLSSISSESIERVELITAPSAQLDAEGSAAVINIVLNGQDAYGTTGSFSLTAGYGYREKASSAFDIAHRTKKVSFTLNYSFLYDRTHQYLLNRRHVSQSSGLFTAATESERFPLQLNYNLRFGLEYEAGRSTKVGFVGGGYANTWEMDALNPSAFSTNSDTIFLLTNNHEINQWKHFIGSGYVIHKINAQQKISVDFDYLYFHDYNPVSYETEITDSNGELLDYLQTRSAKWTPIRFYVGKIDHSLDWKQGTTVESGVKATFSNLTNRVLIEHFDQDGWVTDLELSGKHNLQENIYAGYMSVSSNLANEYSLRAGLRAEYTLTKLSDVTEVIINRKYMRLFPSLIITKMAGENQAQLSYNRRINRPTFNDMAPFVLFLDPQTLFSGNTELWPSITDIVKVELTVKDKLFSLDYSYSNRAIANFQSSIEPGTTELLIRTENLKYSRTTTGMIFLPIRIAPWWRSQHTLAGFFQNIQTDDVKNKKIDTWGYRLNASHTFHLGNNVVVEVAGYYNSKSLFGSIFLQPYGEARVGLSKELGRNSGVIKLSWSDIFYTNKWKLHDSLPLADASIRAGFFTEPRVIRLTYVKNFGKRDLKPIKQRSTGSGEEQQRVTF